MQGFDLFGWLESHSLTSTSLVMLGAVVLWGIYREFRKVKADHEARLKMIKTTDEAVFRLQGTIEDQGKRLAELCDGKGCSNFKEISVSMSRLVESFLRFEKEAHDARNVMYESINRLEKANATFFDGFGAAVLKFMEKGRP